MWSEYGQTTRITCGVPCFYWKVEFDGARAVMPGGIMCQSTHTKTSPSEGGGPSVSDCLCSKVVWDNGLQYALDARSIMNIVSI